jgi:hypothetical protein
MTPHQLDYLYSDAPVALSCRACTVHQCGAFSGHAPLVAYFAYQYPKQTLTGAISFSWAPTRGLTSER